jgi:hypothetical protein
VTCGARTRAQCHILFRLDIWVAQASACAQTSGIVPSSRAPQKAIAEPRSKVCGARTRECSVHTRVNAFVLSQEPERARNVASHSERCVHIRSHDSIRADRFRGPSCMKGPKQVQRSTGGVLSGGRGASRTEPQPRERGLVIGSRKDVFVSRVQSAVNIGL